MESWKSGEANVGDTEMPEFILAAWVEAIGM